MRKGVEHSRERGEDDQRRSSREVEGLRANGGRRPEGEYRGSPIPTWKDG